MISFNFESLDPVVVGNINSTDHTVSESVKIADSVAMTSHKDILGDISKKKGPASFKLFFVSVRLLMNMVRHETIRP